MQHEHVTVRNRFATCMCVSSSRSNVHFLDQKVCYTECTVNSRYSGHPRDRDLVSKIARVRNSGVRENFYFKPYLQTGSHVCSFSLTPVPFPDPLSQVKSVRTLVTNRTELNRTGVIRTLCVQ